MVVAFWSPFPGQSSTSSSILSVALATAVDYKVECSLMQMGYERGGLFNYFMPPTGRVESDYFESNGVDSLIRLAASGSMMPESVVDCSFSFIEKRLNVFTPTSAANEGIYFNSLYDSAKELFTGLNKTFRISFIDLPFGINEYTRLILPLVDLVVVCLPQNKWTIERYYEEVGFYGTNVFFNFGNFDSKQAASLYNIARKYSKFITMPRVGCIPHNPEFADEMNNGNAIAFYLRNHNCKKQDPNAKFVEETKRTTEKILKLCKINTNGVGGSSE